MKPTEKKVESALLGELISIEDIKEAGGAYNLRKNGAGVERFSTKDIQITSKTDKPGIDITVDDEPDRKSVV